MASPHLHEETAEIEGCIRSFIIRSIHGIVQSRCGSPYSTTCISDVGARNNLMIYIEEDPEIGATIKQNFDSGFPIRVGDIFSLEILLKNALGRLVGLEVWQFRLDTEDNLLRRGRLPCSKVVANHSGLQPTISSLPAAAAGTAGVVAPNVAEAPQSPCFAVEDFRRSRLFERLASLLKTLVVTTRMLPAYAYTRNQQHDMRYTLCRGDVPHDRLGGDGSGAVLCRQVGHLSPGLAVGPGATPLFLNVSVRYRADLSSIDYLQPSPVTATAINQPSGAQRRPRSRRPCVRPAFAATLEDEDEYLEGSEEEEEGDREGDGEGFEGEMDDERLTYRIGCEGLPEAEGEFYYDEVAGRYYYLQDEQLTEETAAGEAGFLSSSSDDSDEDDAAMSRTFVSDEANPYQRSGGGTGEPLHLAFASIDLAAGDAGLKGVEGSVSGFGCARMAHMVAELRKKKDLDLFRVPGSTGGSGGGTSTSVFDASALGDELVRHEQRLREFDDFLADFCAAGGN